MKCALFMALAVVGCVVEEMEDVPMETSMGLEDLDEPCSDSGCISESSDEAGAPDADADLATFDPELGPTCGSDTLKYSSQSSWGCTCPGMDPMVCENPGACGSGPGCGEPVCQYTAGVWNTSPAGGVNRCKCSCLIPSRAGCSYGGWVAGSGGCDTGASCLGTLYDCENSTGGWHTVQPCNGMCG